MLQLPSSIIPPILETNNIDNRSFFLNWRVGFFPLETVVAASGEMITRKTDSNSSCPCMPFGLIFYKIEL